MEPEWNSSPDQDDVEILGLRPSEFVSQLYFSLDNDIDCNRLCQEVARYIAKNNNNNGIKEGRVLILTIKDTKVDDQLIPKLEYRDDL